MSTCVLMQLSIHYSLSLSYSQVNVDGFHNIIELCREHKLRLFSPSTIGAFGPESPKHMCPDLTIMRPKTVYGVSKVYMELLGEVNTHDGNCMEMWYLISWYFVNENVTHEMPKTSKT